MSEEARASPPARREARRHRPPVVAKLFFLTQEDTLFGGNLSFQTADVAQKPLFFRTRAGKLCFKREDRFPPLIVAFRAFQSGFRFFEPSFKRLESALRLLLFLPQFLFRRREVEVLAFQVFAVAALQVFAHFESTVYLFHLPCEEFEMRRDLLAQKLHLRDVLTGLLEFFLALFFFILVDLKT